MRVVLQRVSQAEVTVSGETTGRIGPGLLALIAVSRQDDENDLLWMARKIVGKSSDCVSLMMIMEILI